MPVKVGLNCGLTAASGKCMDLLIEASVRLVVAQFTARPALVFAPAHGSERHRMQHSPVCPVSWPPCCEAVVRVVRRTCSTRAARGTRCLCTSEGFMGFKN